MIKLDESLVNNVIQRAEIDSFIDSHTKFISEVLAGQYGMKDAADWLSPAKNATEQELDTIIAHAEKIRQNADTFVLAGVGGSNRAAQSVIEGLEYSRNKKPRIMYMGNTLSSQAMQNCLKDLEGKSVYGNIIAKNFTTLEPGLAFRAIRSWMKKNYGSGYADRITVTGSCTDGQLAEIAARNGYSFFEFPAHTGGRFSAFTAVSLLPMAVMGADIMQFIKGAQQCEQNLKADPAGGIAARYAALRFLLQKKGFTTESLSYFEPSLEMLGRWWLQLHGETEGKKPDAVLPILSCFSEDLHAIGQYYQEGGRFLFETFLGFFKATGISIPFSDFDDGFSFLDGKTFDTLNPAVSKATIQAHYEAGIPVLQFTADKIDEKFFGEFMYLQMVSAYFSAAFLGVEPFNQNGVENYKSNLKKELEKK